MSIITRCPYRVAGNEFKPMTAQMEGGLLLRWLCERCGHVVKPGEKDPWCTCAKCCQMRVPVGDSLSAA
jgi:hypothetical protein